MDDNQRRSESILESFYHDSLRAERLQTLLSVVEAVKVSKYRYEDSFKVEEGKLSIISRRFWREGLQGTRCKVLAFLSTVK